MNEPEIQRLYYAETASRYETMHHGNDDEHFFALCYLIGILDFLRIKSILEIGSGTGRVIQCIKKCRPELRVIGIEPVAELREIGYSNGLSRGDLFAGDGTALQFDASSFDLVCEFGILHHVSTPEIVVAEMLRVARQAIFISDSNNFGQGSLLARTVKQSFNMLGLWKLIDLVKTGGKGYTFSEGDGLGYSYSVFNNYDQIESQCRTVHLLNTKDGRVNPYRTASHVALLGIKD